MYVCINAYYVGSEQYINYKKHPVLYYFLTRLWVLQTNNQIKKQLKFGQVFFFTENVITLI